MAAGSQIRIDKNGITITTPNQFTARAAQHIFQGGATVNVNLPNFLKYRCKV
jgi:type VI secretion system secreted protein VgrG